MRKSYSINFYTFKLVSFLTFRIYDHSKTLEYSELIDGNSISNCPIPCLSSKVLFYLPGVALYHIPLLYFVLTSTPQGICKTPSQQTIELWKVPPRLLCTSTPRWRWPSPTFRISTSPPSSLNWAVPWGSGWEWGRYRSSAAEWPLSTG